MCFIWMINKNERLVLYDDKQGRSMWFMWMMWKKNEDDADDGNYNS